jgi:hypothetical protein
MAAQLSELAGWILGKAKAAHAEGMLPDDFCFAIFAEAGERNLPQPGARFVSTLQSLYDAMFSDEWPWEPWSWPVSPDGKPQE